MAEARACIDCGLHFTPDIMHPREYETSCFVCAQRRKEWSPIAKIIADEVERRLRLIGALPVSER